MGDFDNQAFDHDNSSIERNMSQLQTLLVEPSLPQQKAICQFLEGEGVFDISKAQSGEECFIEMDAFLPDLIISSMYLPDMTGAELVQTMRNNEHYEHIPFLLVSSETNVSQLEPIRQAGVVGILAKPFDSEDLQNALCSAYDMRFLDNLLDGSTIDYNNLDVLVADDSALSRKHLGRVLNKFGIKNLDFAEDGRQAADLINERNYDVLISDYHMPEMDGEARLRYVREESRQKALPALVITSEQNQDSLLWADTYGAKVCDKPFAPRCIGRIISELLN